MHPTPSLIIGIPMGSMTWSCKEVGCWEVQRRALLTRHLQSKHCSTGDPAWCLQQHSCNQLQCWLDELLRLPSSQSCCATNVIVCEKRRSCVSQVLYLTVCYSVDAEHTVVLCLVLNYSLGYTTICGIILFADTPAKVQICHNRVCVQCKCACTCA